MYSVPKLTDFSSTKLDDAVRELLSALESDAKNVTSESEFKAFRDRWMARKNGVLTQVNDLWLKIAPKDSKREVGQRSQQFVAGLFKRASRMTFQLGNRVRQSCAPSRCHSGPDGSSNPGSCPSQEPKISCHFVRSDNSQESEYRRGSYTRAGQGSMIS